MELPDEKERGTARGRPIVNNFIAAGKTFYSHPDLQLNQTSETAHSHTGLRAKRPCGNAGGERVRRGWLRLIAIGGRFRRRSPRTTPTLPDGARHDTRLVQEPFWQQNEFRSSFPECVGKQTSFGVVKTLSTRLGDLFQGNLRPLKGRPPSILLLKQQNLTPHKTGGRSRSEIITPKLALLPSGTPGLLRNSIRCHRDPEGQWASRPTAPPGPTFDADAGGAAAVIVSQAEQQAKHLSPTKTLVTSFT